MLCQKCGKNGATVRIYYEVNGHTIYRDLCDECADIRCSCCGSTFENIAQSGKCGCSHCYEKFYDKLMPRIKKIHGSTKHIGKTSVTAFNRPKDDIFNLRKELKLLVEQENYEQAAVVRDKIKALEAKTQ